MSERFDIAGGSVAGRDHVIAGRNNQDAWAWHRSERGLVAVVCDGCSSGRRSEVGAELGARLAVQAIHERLGETRVDESVLRSDDFWASIQDDVLRRLRTVIEAHGDDADALVLDCFLFTVVGALVTDDRACVFHFGDGFIALEGKAISIGPYEDNAPPYLGYALLRKGPPRFPKEALRFVVPQVVPTGDLSSLLIGSDGLADFDRVGDSTLPGTRERLGGVAQFWTDEGYVRNPDAIRRRLALANRPSVKLDRARQTLIRESGLLPDDTTLIVIRRSNDATLN